MAYHIKKKTHFIILCCLFSVSLQKLNTNIYFPKKQTVASQVPRESSDCVQSESVTSVQSVRFSFSFDRLHELRVLVTSMILSACFFLEQATVCHVRAGLFGVLHQLQDFKNRNKIIHFFPIIAELKEKKSAEFLRLR